MSLTRLLGSVGGGLLAGAAISALESDGATGAEASWADRLGPPALAGLIYAGLGGRDRSPIRSGLGYGLGAYVMARFLVGPALGLTKSDWDEPSSRVGRRIAASLATGLSIAIGARVGRAISSDR